MKIGFITTIDTNIGDDFIRTGIENIIVSLKDRSEIDFTYVNKHKPETALLPNSPLQRLRRMRPFPGRGHLMKFFDGERYASNSVYKLQDLIIQSGAPVLWPDCQKNEWAIPIWYKTIGKLKDKIPVLNLAAGSCYPWEKQEGFISPAESTYASDIGGFCKLTTTRDRLANRLFQEAGVQNFLMPCTAFFVAPEFENRSEARYILINYMKGGGHFDWDQHVDPVHWENLMKDLINELRKEHEVHFICHNQKEVDEAKDLFPGLPIHFPKSVAEYLECIRQAKMGINNRMHASVAMGSVGVPAISICTDTRLLMLENIGLPIHYVKDTTFERLKAEAFGLLDNFEQERKRLFDLKKGKFSEYQALLKPFLH